MAILVTGGAGYIGSVMVEILRLKGLAVVVLDDLSRGHRAALDPDVPLYVGDIGDASWLKRFFWPTGSTRFCTSRHRARSENQ